MSADPSIGGSLPDPISGARERFAAACRVLQDAIARRGFPGCSFGVWADGETVLLDGLGRFTYEDDAPAVTAATVFDVASLTKVAATTAMAMLLHQRGVLDLELPLADLLPGFAVGRAAGDGAMHVRLRHLLAHNSGLPGYVRFFETARTPMALFRACLQLELEAEPGTRTEYSDPGFILLGKALEVLTGEHLAEWVRREVFHPLGMSATGFCPALTEKVKIPPTEEDPGFRRRRIQGDVQDENAWVLKGAAGHAGLFSNVPDLLKLAAGVIRPMSAYGSAEMPAEGPAQKTGTGGVRLWKRETVEVFAARQQPPGSSRALGWDTPSENSSAGSHFSKRSIGHLGYSGCSLWIDLDARVGVVLLTNRTWPDRSSQLIREVRPAFHDAIRKAL